MIPLHLESAKPVSAFEVLRPQEGAAEMTTAVGFTRLRINMRPQSDVLISVLSAGTQPFDPARMISADPTEIVDWLDYQHLWAPGGAAEFTVSERMEGARMELDY